MFKDYFSNHATQYSQARPTYPKTLFEYLASLANHHELAWDCATGNGQAAVALADYFDKVIATDGSETQLSHAPQKNNIEYRQALAEDSGLADNSVDLITVAQALHWFDLDKFYAEVKRVSKPNSILAVWCYVLLRTNNDTLNQLIDEFYVDVIGDYWPPGRHYIDEHYRTLPFPFAELTTPDFAIENHWSLGQLMNYLQTWSAVKGYENKVGNNPVDNWLMPRIEKNIKITDEVLDVTMPLVVKVAKA